MSHEMLVSSALLASSMALAGIAFGLVYFAALQKTAALFATGGGWLGPSALTLSRIGAAMIFFTFAVKLGAASLLAAFTGFLVARAIAVRATRPDM